MEATVKIDGKDVRFKATAAVPLMYRCKFRRDLIQDIQSVAEEMAGKEATGGNLPLHALTMFECMAYIMAKHADPAMAANSPEEWLEGFSTMSIYAVFPVIQALWEGNMERLVEAKKKRSNRSEIYNAVAPAPSRPARSVPARFRAAGHRTA